MCTELTQDMIRSMEAVRNGADVYSYLTAITLREVEKKHPEMIRICKPQAYEGDGTDQVPYFGAILTAAGRQALDKAEA